MGFLIEISISVAVVAGTYLAYRYFEPNVKVSEAVGCYKVGRLTQIAKDKGIDLLKMMSEKHLTHENVLNSQWEKKIEKEIENSIGEPLPREEKKD